MDNSFSELRSIVLKRHKWSIIAAKSDNSIALVYANTDKKLIFHCNYIAEMYCMTSLIVTSSRFTSILATDFINN